MGPYAHGSSSVDGCRSNSGGGRGLGLEPHGGLELVDAELVRVVALDERVARLVAAGRVPVGGAAPRGHGRVAHPGELAGPHGRAAVVGAQQQRVAVDALELAALHARVLGALEEDRGAPVQGPVAARGHAPGVQEGRARVAEAEAS